MRAPTEEQKEALAEAAEQLGNARRARKALNAAQDCPATDTAIAMVDLELRLAERRYKICFAKASGDF